MRNAYYKLPDGETDKWWCRTHKRIATHVWFSEGMLCVEVHCDPNAAGIMISCACVPISRKQEFES